MNAKQLIDEAVSLPVEERALVVDSLLKSFSLSSADIDEQWLAVARNRLKEMRAGDVKPVFRWRRVFTDKEQTREMTILFHPEAENRT